MSALDDTICAVATPAGEGGVGIVRVSGSQAFPIAENIVRLRCGKSLSEIKPYQLYLGKFLWDQFRAQGTVEQDSSVVLDEVLVVIMRGPRSYTGEDVVEVHGHGGPLIVRAICEALTQAGARIAEPGEFTKRAFLNGRLDLTQAEAVLDTIQANSLHSLKLAQEHLQGGLSGVIQDHRDALVKLLAHVEAGMDFGEEDIQFIEQKELIDKLGNMVGAIEKLVDSAQEGRIIREGVRTVILGRPNVGKSSLLNAILDVDRAIVSQIPGTTRDVLEESVTVEGVMIRLFDTAGLRETTNELEQEGMTRAEAAIKQADVLVMAFDQSQALTEQDVDFIKQYSQKPRVMILNKHDLPPKVSLKDFQAIVRQYETHNEQATEFVQACAVTGEGIDQVKRTIKKLTVGHRYEAGDSVLVSRLRHKVLLQQAAEALHNALTAIDDTQSAECLALELRMALSALGEIVGTVTNEDILDQIFREFCIGK
jgi:tRNA modification GTPase